MSLANFYHNGKVFIDNEVSNIETIKLLNIKGEYKTISHSVDSTGKYNVVDNNSLSLISFDNTNSLTDCALKQHITNQVSPLSRTIATHTTSLTSHESRLTGLETLPNTENIIILQAQVSELIAYNNKLKQFILAIKESLFITKSANDNSEFDFTGII